MKNIKYTDENKVQHTYGFEIDINDFIQVGETRFFEITGSKDSLNKFLKDNDLFQESV